NDTLAPAPKHFEGKPPSSDEVYRTVLRGGIFNNLPNKTFPSKDQFSMDVLLGPGGPAAIAFVLNDLIRATGDKPGEPSQAIKDAAQLVFDEVKVVMKALLTELKTPGSGSQGLNELMKAQSNLVGMGYSTFKVKCRFADLMVNYNPDSEEAVKKALAY